MWLFFVLSSSFAAEPAWYHPDDVAAASKVFGGVSDTLAPRYEDLQARIEVGASAAAEVELGVALLGGLATPELKAWSDTTRRQIVGEVLRARRHMDLLAEDFGRVFGASMERALAIEGAGKTVTECASSSPLPGLSKRNNCSGTPLSAALAARMDTDPALAKELASIAEVPWPTVPLPSATVAPIPLTGTTRWVSLARLSQALIGTHLTALQDDLDVALEGISDGLDARDPAAIAEAEKLRAAWATRVAAAGETTRAAAAKALEKAAKKGGPTELGWCVNPKSLGGCTGEDQTSAVITLLKDDKSVGKALSGLR